MACKEYLTNGNILQKNFDFGFFSAKMPKISF